VAYYGVMRCHFNNPKLIYSSIAYQRFCEDAGKFELLSKEEEKVLAKEIKRGGKKAKEAMEKLAVSNLRLVVTIAKSYTGMGLDIEDLISEGNIGLLEAAKRFRADKGAKFSTYAALWIKQSMRRALTNKGRTIRVPTSAIDKYREMKAFVSSFLEENNRAPSLQEISEKVNTPVSRVSDIFAAVEGLRSLDACAGVDDKREVHELMFSSTRHIPDAATVKNEESNLLRVAMRRVLDERERFIIERRFGLDDDRRETLENIGKKLKITRERVRQIQEVALFKIKNEVEGTLKL